MFTLSLCLAFVGLACKDTLLPVFPTMPNSTGALALACSYVRGEEPVPDLLAELLKSAKGKDSVVRARAIQGIRDKSFKQFHRWPKQVVPVLLEALTDESPLVRRQAADALHFYSDERVVPALLRALEDMDRAEVFEGNVPQRAILALGTLGLNKSLGEHAPEVVAALIRKTPGDTFYVATSSLGSIGSRYASTAPMAVKALMEILEDKHRSFPERGTAAGALLKIGRAGKEAVPVLRKALEVSELPVDADAIGFRSIVLSALGAIGSAAAPAVPDVVTILRNKMEDYTCRQRAAEALGGIGISTTDVVAALREATRDDIASVAQAAKKSLKKISK